MRTSHWMVVLCSATGLGVPLRTLHPASGQGGQVEVNLEVPARITKGEPLIADVTVVNGLERTIDVDMGWNQVGAFDIEAVLPGGRRSVGRAQPPPLGGISKNPRVVLKPTVRLSH